ncbi:MAG: hypothetical protein V3T05_08630 [Myxococcota bacterium]
MSAVALTLMTVLSGPATTLRLGSDVQQALKLLADDPPIAGVQKAALEYFAVTQDDVAGYRSASRLKALMPALSGSYTRDDNRLDRNAIDRAVYGVGSWPGSPQTTDLTTGAGRAYVASATWELGSLVFDPSELEAYALVGIHEDILKEVTRLYFTRQHNIIALALDPPKDVRAQAALVLRTNEIEAMLDALTGGKWSKMRRAKRP